IVHCVAKRRITRPMSRRSGRARPRMNTTRCHGRRKMISPPRAFSAGKGVGCFSRIIASSRNERCGAAVVPAEEVVMAKQPARVRRKLVEFDEETWAALDLLGRDSMKTLQELADEAFGDLLRKYDRPTDLKAALKQSARSSAAPHAVTQNRKRGGG